MERVTVSATNTTNGSILTMNQHNPQLPFSTTTTATISLHQKLPFPSFPPPKRHHLHQQRPTNTPDTELSIFSAERYFKEDDLQKETPTFLPPSPLKKCQPTTTTLPLHYPRTPSSTTHQLPISAITTASSEASWNSQVGLLPPHPPSSSSSAATPGRSPRWRFRYLPCCPCSGKRSVDIEEKFAEFKSSYLSSSTYGSSSATFTPAKQTTVDDPPPRITVDDRDLGFLVSGMARLEILPGKWEKPEEAFSLHHDENNNNNNNAFSFPILAKPTTAAAEEEPPRDSLEVFRPRESGCSPSAVTPRRRSADLLGRWALRHPPTEEMRRSFTFSESPRRPREDDLASDASSDLFEIDSFSTSTAPPPLPPSTAPASLRRESLDEPELGGAGDEPARPSACYPPSEVSVQWSVTTAEGYASLANFSRAASECGGPAAEREAVGGGGVAGRKKAGGGGGGGGLLMMSCRSTKAVDVAPPLMRHVVEGRRSGPERPALTQSLSARANRPLHGV